MKIPHCSGRKIRHVPETTVCSFSRLIKNETGWSIGGGSGGTNPPRNGWAQTHQADGPEAISSPARSHIGLIDSPMPEKTHSEWQALKAF
jgi:hypothetical protein